MTEQNTLDKINSWATDKYTSAAPSLMNGSMSGSAASTVEKPPAAGQTASLLSAAAPSAPGKVDVASWYRSTLGRDGDAGGISFWQKALDGGANAEELYGKFQSAAGSNKEAVKSGTSWQTANEYKGPQSTDQGTVVDDWGRNVLGRDLTGEESATWRAKMAGAASPEAATQVYNEFVSANGNNVKNRLDLAGASQISGARDAAANPYTINKDELARRNIDGKTETVQGQLGTILAADSPVLQQARADGMRTGFDRGLGNSSIAASAGEDALIRAATGIATTDSGYFNKAADYNVAAENQLTMWNGEQTNQFRLGDKQLAADQAGRDAQLAQQMTIQQMQDATSRWNSEQQTANSRYNTDLAYNKDVDNQKMGVANNIIANMDLSPDRKAAMLEQLGLGTMAKPGVPGTGLAGAVFVLDSIGAELSGAAAGSEQYYTG